MMIIMVYNMVVVVSSNSSSKYRCFFIVVVVVVDYYDDVIEERTQMVERGFCTPKVTSSIVRIHPSTKTQHNTLCLTHIIIFSSLVAKK